jgi:hypothetical protein
LIFDDFQLSINSALFEELFSQDSHHYRWKNIKSCG